MSSINQLSVSKAFLMGICLAMSACSSIQPIGQLGPRRLPVYAISQNDFLSSNHMLVVLDKRGDVKAYSGGTVAGPGSLGVEMAGTLATAGAIAYGARAIESGMKNARVKGIPQHIKLKADVDLTGSIKDFK